MQNQIVINVDPGETRVALLENSNFSELHVERKESVSVVGNVVKGRVSRVLPGMQAAFVDIGLEKAAFLYVGDYFDNTDPDASEGPRGRGRHQNRRSQPPGIDTVLSEGQEIVVQIAKAPIGSKGARITSNISIPGRHLVLTPWSKRIGVSRRIGSDKERKRLREIVHRLKPDNLGFIIRTAGDGVREADLEADIRYLESAWKNIQLRNAESVVPNVLHAEPDLPLRIIRDAAGPETKRILTDEIETHRALEHFVTEFVAEPRPTVEHYTGPKPLFDEMNLEAQIHANLERKVPLKSGGSLVIDQCEALTAIDVNTGGFVGKRDLEETVFKANLEAVKEVVHQLRFRNIGGLIIIDLIDMESADHREKVYRALRDALRADKSRTNILKISELGLVEMTRKRTRENLVQALCEPCPNCEGRGFLLSGQTVAHNILREIRNDLPKISGRKIAIAVSPRVAEELLRIEEEPLAKLAADLGREIEIRARPGLHQEQFEVEALDDGPPVETELRWLRDPAEIAAEEENLAKTKAESKQATKSRRTRGGRQRGKGNRGTSEKEKGSDSPEEKKGAAPQENEAATTDLAPVVPETETSLESPSTRPEAQKVEVLDATPEIKAPESNEASDDSESTQNAKAPEGSTEGPPDQDQATKISTASDSNSPELELETPKATETTAQALDDTKESRILPRS
ncbi:MAG: Rne/Rng family ribonuclease [Deltaproteobacteria bacterium]|nr:Rne/Rng family ribonuclease [Deltaproteobacteria bacterium]